MKIIFLLFLCFFVHNSKGQVIELDPTSFAQAKNSHDYAFIYFYSYDCKECIATEIQFPKLSNSISNENIFLGKVNSTAYPDLAKENKIKKYPSLIFLDQGHSIKFSRGSSSSKQMQRWIQKYLQKRVISVGEEQIESKKKPYLLIKGGQQKQLKSINNALYNVDHLTFYHLNKEDKELNISLHLADSTQAYFNEKYHPSRLTKWIEQNLKTILEPLKSKNSTDHVLLNKQLPGLIVVFTGNDRKDSVKFNSILQICQQNKEKIVCGQILPQYNSFKGAHDFFKVRNKKSFIAVVKDEMKIAYTMDSFQNLTKTILEKFIQDALDDKIERTVDNTIPTQVKFHHVILFSPQEFEKAIKQNEYVFMNYYKQEPSSLFFSRRYQLLAENVKGQSELKDVIIGAMDCGKHQKYCQDQKFTHSPYLRLFVNGYKIQYPKTQKLPQIPDLNLFMFKKKSKQIEKLVEEDFQKLEKPLVIIQSQSLTTQLKTIASICHQIPFYHKNTDSKQVVISIHHSNQVFKYEGQLNVQSISQWILSEAQNLLIDIMKQNPDERLQEATKNGQPILLLLSLSSDKQKKFKTKLGLLCKKLSISGTFSDDTSSQFSSVLNWVGFNEISESKLLYVDLKKDEKYLYDGSLDELTYQSAQKFILSVIKGQIKQQGPPEVEKKEEQVPISEQL